MQATALQVTQAHQHLQTQTSKEFPHIGRVLGVGTDHRSQPLQHKGAIILEVQVVFLPQQLQSMVLPALDPPLLDNEAMLSQNQTHFISEEDVGVQVTNVVLNYLFQDDKLRFTPPSEDGFLLIRRVHDDLNDSAALPMITSLCKCHPIRGELEIKTYGRQYLEQFDKNLSGRKTISIPLITFINGFGLYRNAYRSLMGMYFIPASLSFHERARRVNVFPLTLGPHGSNFADVVDAMKARLAVLDKGIEVQIKGETVLLCTPTTLYAADMPQQQKNAGMKSQRAILGCRYCFITNDQRADLDFDTFTNGRYHYQTVNMRKEMDALKTVAARDKYAKENGLDTAYPCLLDISPSLDILLSRPSDPAHSEYQGLASLMHNLLLDTVLTSAAGREYAAMLRTFPFPPSWPRIQGPLHHLKSYNMAEHARWSIVIPLLLRLWLRERHVQPNLLIILKKRQQDGATALNPLDQIVECYTAATTSNCVLMGESISLKDRANLHYIVIDHRLKLQGLLQFASDSMTANPRRRRSISMGSQGSRSSQASRGNIPSADEELGPIEGDTTSAQAKDAMADKAQLYLNDMKRPNMHLALHYGLVAEEYAMPSNCNTLIGEDKHR